MKSLNLTTASIAAACSIVCFAGIPAVTLWMPDSNAALIPALGGAATVFSGLSLICILRMRSAVSDAGQAIGQIIKGNLDKRIAPFGTFDSVGVLQHRLNNLFDVVDLATRGKDAMVDAELDGDYYHKIAGSPLKKLMDGFAASRPQIAAIEESHQAQVIAFPAKNISHDMMSGMREVSGHIANQTQRMQELAGRIVSLIECNSSSGSGIVDAAQQARYNVETVAAAAEELTYSIREISERVAESSRIAAQAVAHANHSNEIVNGLNKASERIGNVVSLITDIAGQTNLLALNATIEAARAGEAGRGFAVVASEVKSLADQTAKATEEISQQISTIQSSTGSAVKAIHDIGTTIGKINEISTAIAAAVEEQSAATGEISRNIQHAASGTQAVAESITKLSSSDEETKRTAHDALQIANQISEQIAVLGAEMDEGLKQTA